MIPNRYLQKGVVMSSRLGVGLSLVLLTVGLNAADNLEEAFKNAKTTGQVRAFYIDRTYSGKIVNNRNALAVGGSLGMETEQLNGLSVGAKFYTVNGINLHDGSRSSVGSVKYDPSLYGDDFSSYSMLGEAYLKYCFYCAGLSNSTLTIGRQKLNTPLAAADDARMLPNLFEAAVLTNTDIIDTTLVAAHVTKEAVGTFGNVYGKPSQLSLQSGYGLGYKLGTTGHFVDMGKIALGESADTDGVSAVAAIYSGIKGLKLQAWDYVAHDILNAIYLQADFGWNCLLSDSVKMKASVQYINEADIGDKLAGDVDSNYMGAKVGTTIGAVSGYVAYSTTDSSSGNQANGGIITPWGGIPAFTQGMVTRHMFLADTDTMKVAATYSLKDLGINASATAYYAEFDVGSLNTYKAGTAWTAKESGFDIKYSPSSVKNLQLRLRANYPTDFAPGVDWDEYRVIANYNF
jgi:hypothetical protein